MDQAQVTLPGWRRAIYAPSINLIRAASLAGALLVWEVLSRSGIVYGGVVPPIEAIVVALWTLLGRGEFYSHLAVTATEVGVGFAIAAAGGVVFGVLIGASRYLGDAVDPYVDGMATAPKTIFLPILMLLFGIDTESKIALGALAGIFPILINTAAGVRSLNPVYVRVGTSFGLTRRQIATKIYLPALEDWMVTGMRLGLGVTIVGVLLGEIKLSNRGLGFLANNYYSHFRIPELYGLLIAIFCLAAFANVAIGRAPAALRALRRRG